MHFQFNLFVPIIHILFGWNPVFIYMFNVYVQVSGKDEFISVKTDSHASNDFINKLNRLCSCARKSSSHKYQTEHGRRIIEREIYTDWLRGLSVQYTASNRIVNPRKHRYRCVSLMKCDLMMMNSKSQDAFHWALKWASASLITSLLDAGEYTFKTTHTDPFAARRRHKYIRVHNPPWRGICAAESAMFISGWLFRQIESFSSKTLVFLNKKKNYYGVFFYWILGSYK